MYPRLVKVTLLLPWQPPQVVVDREVARGIYRLQLTDRFERLVNYVGSDIGFGVRLYKSTMNQSYIVVKGRWDQAIYSSERQNPVSIQVLDLEDDDAYYI